MLCCRDCVGLFFGGWFVAKVTMVSVPVDAWPLMLLVFLGWILCHCGLVSSVDNLCIKVFFSRRCSLSGFYSWGPSLSLFPAALVCFMSSTTILVVCNLRYEGSLVLVSRNCFSHNEICATICCRKKQKQQNPSNPLA